MNGRILKQIYEIPLTLLTVTALSFILMRLSTVSPAEAYARRNTARPTAENIARISAEMGLDHPLPVQYGIWIGNALRLDFGQSLVNGRDAAGELLQTVPVTLQVVGLSTVVQMMGCVFLGYLIYAVRDTRRADLVRGMTIACLSVPAFYAASLYLELFAVRLGWIAVAGRGGLADYFHPALCLAVPGIAFYGRMLGRFLLAEMQEDYARFAQSRGLTDRRIVWRHALPHAIVALLPSFLQNIGFTLVGAAVLERVFSLPGVGYQIIESVLARDAPMIHLAVLFLAVAFIAVNALAQLCHYALTPDRPATGKAFRL